MSFLTPKTFRRLWSPSHRLACEVGLWRRLVRELRKRGDGRRESGAFLLGHIEDNLRTVTGFVMYDDIDPRALDSGYVRIDGRRMGKLWDMCRAKKVSVVADIHTHPGSHEQSDIDRQNPMVSMKGHIGIILPAYAMRPVARRHMGIYVYRGSHEWDEVDTSRNHAFFYIGL